MGRKEAVEKWKEFHDKIEPGKEYTIEAPGGFYPKTWAYGGLVTTCFYRSDKWEPNGKFNQYYHDHGRGIRCWHPWGMFGHCQRKRPGISKFPDTLTVLGFSQGWDVKTPDGLELTYTPEKGEWLCCYPDGSALVVVAQDGKMIALFEGQGLRVESRGIVG